MSKNVNTHETTNTESKCKNMETGATVKSNSLASIACLKVLLSFAKISAGHISK